MAGPLHRRGPALLMTDKYPVQIDEEDLHMRCRAAMFTAGLTTQDVADYMGLRVSWVHIAMNGGGRYSMPIRFLVNFCAICGCTIADLLPFVNDPIPFPHTFTVVGGGAVTSVTPDPYRITMTDPETLGAEGWSRAPRNEV